MCPAGTRRRKHTVHWTTHINVQFICGVPPAAATGKRKTRQVKKDKKRHNGLAETPLRVLDRPTDSDDLNLNHRVSIENMVYIGSYSWVDSTEPTIIVPGSPAIWRDRRAPYTLSPDRMTFVYEDAYRMPSFPNLARMKAIDIITEEKGIRVDWPGVDFVTDRNALRKLLRWASGSTGRDFRIDLELVGERTIFLNRWEEKNRVCVDRCHPSYGFSFEHASTRPALGCEGTTGHHRISSYSFGGLNMVVSYEVDACIATTTPNTARTSVGAPVQSSRSHPSNRSATGATGASKSGKSLKIIRAGFEVPQTSLLELKSSTKISWTETYPQLYLGQIPYLYHGIHNHGKVRQIMLRARTEEALLRVDASLQANFRKLRDALRTIQAFVVEHGHRGHLTLVYEPKHARCLEVYRRTSQASCLPSEILQRFTRPGN